MTTLLPKQRVVDAIAEELAALHELVAGLAPAEWKLATPCPGWDVQAQVAHVIGTECMLEKIDPPPGDQPVPAHVRNDIGKFNEAWIGPLASETPDEMLARLRSITEQRLASLAAIDDAAWNAESFTPAGPDTYGRFMRIRVFDSWMHEQDIRVAIGRPGHDSGPAVELVLDEMQGALGFVVGKKASAPTGTSVTFSLTGESGREVHVAVGERAAVVDSLEGPATTTLRMPVLVFTRLAGGRSDGPDLVDQVEVSGDEELGARVLANLAYTI